MPEMMKKFVRGNEKVGSDIDAARLREIFENAIETVNDLLQKPDFGTSIQSARNILESVLVTRMAPPTVALPLYNNIMPDLLLIMDVRKRKISAVSNRFPDKRALLNSVLKVVKHG
jgi:hypothetical protein